MTGQRVGVAALVVATGLLGLLPAPQAAGEELKAPQVRVGLTGSLFRDVPDALVTTMMRPFKSLMEAQTGLSGQFADIMTRGGIVGKIRRHTPNGRANSSLSFHSLRHSFNSAMANAGVSQEIRMKLTGHSSAEMNKGYTHHELEPLRAAIAVLPGIGAN